jgi:type II secretory pathway pseudopilin PulG
MGCPKPTIKSGFSLVELLLALSIMFAVLVLAATAYQLYTNSWKRDLSKIEQSYQRLRFHELMLDALQGIIPQSVTESIGNDKTGFYFLGREEGFTAVSASPIYNVQAPAVIRIFREQNENGTLRLVYEEASLARQPLIYSTQELSFSYRKILLDNLTSLEFSYYGWASSQARVDSLSEFENEIEKGWFIEYDGLARRYHPDQIRIEINGFQLTIAVPNRTDLGLADLSEEAI